MGRLTGTCARIANAAWFQNGIVGVILLNALVLGLQTYENIEREHGRLLHDLNDVFLAIFVVELIIRITAYGRRPLSFFSSGWNIFDFVVVMAAFVPGLRENATALRIIRLLRVVRLLSVLPDLRVFIRAVVRSLAPIGSMAVLALFFLYVYGMIGWILFKDGDPERFGTITRAMLAMFTVLTLEGWPDLLYDSMRIHSYAWVYFLSFVLLASFILLNILIAIIINSMEEARLIEREERRAERKADREEEEEDDEQIQLRERLDALKDAVEDLEDQLSKTGSTPRTGHARAR